MQELCSQSTLNESAESNITQLPALLYFVCVLTRVAPAHKLKEVLNVTFQLICLQICTVQGKKMHVNKDNVNNMLAKLQDSISSVSSCAHSSTHSV